MTKGQYIDLIIDSNKRRHKRLLYLSKRTKNKRIKEKLIFKINVRSLVIQTLERIRSCPEYEECILR